MSCLCIKRGASRLMLRTLSFKGLQDCTTACVHLVGLLRLASHAGLLSAPAGFPAAMDAGNPAASVKRLAPILKSRLDGGGGGKTPLSRSPGSGSPAGPLAAPGSPSASLRPPLRLPASPLLAAQMECGAATPQFLAKPPASGFAPSAGA